MVANALTTARPSSPAPASKQSLLGRGVASLIAAARSALQWSYDAVEGRGKRKLPKVDTRGEDSILSPVRRAKLQANARDLARNFSICAWMIRRHLDYVTQFSFRALGENEELNRRIETFVAGWSSPERFDAASRHSLSRSLRLAETRAVIDGDVGLLMLADGTVQSIASDRIRDPRASEANGEWTHGVRLGRAGRALAYAIHRRAAAGFELERIVPASRMLLHGYYDGFDQIRGISPLAAALNPLRDCYENFDLALAKAKVTQLFALAIFRRASESPGELLSPKPGESMAKDGYVVDFGGGPIMLDMDPGDEAKFLESQHPSTQFQDFTNAMLGVALKALDLPISFFDESWTNFFGSRGALLHYERACRSKREALADVLHRLTFWRLGLAVLDGELELPAGVTLDDLDWEWTAIGTPWWKPSEEINGDVQAIAAGLTNPFLVCQERGRPDPLTNLRETARVKAEADRLGIGLSFVAQYPAQVDAGQPAAA